MPIEQLHATLSTLSLTAVEARLESLLERAAQEESAYADFLQQVLSTETDARRQRYLKMRLQLAHLPYSRTPPSRRPHQILVQPSPQPVCAERAQCHR